MNVQREARARVRLMRAKIQELDRRPDLIPLTDYADAETFNFLLPRAGWTFEEWRAVNVEVGRQLSAEGFKVQFAKVTLNEFFDFLTRYHLDNTPENRAQFAAWVIAPEPKPNLI